MNHDLFSIIPHDVRSQAILTDIQANHPQELQFLEHLLTRDPALNVTVPSILFAFDLLVQRFAAGHTLFLCGNGGSFSDSMHIAGELVKSFNFKRYLSPADKAAFAGVPYSDNLTQYLEYGLPCIVLGFNHALNSAILNDSGKVELQYAQELYVMGRPGDVLIGISTSGNARNVLHAIAVAKIRGMSTIGLTGQHGGELAQAVDVAIKTPETKTPYIQEQHEVVYHALCAMLEVRFFGKQE